MFLNNLNGISQISAHNQVIFYEQDWNPQVDKQALQRAHRIGQMNHVLSINLVTEHTVEEVRYYILLFGLVISATEFLYCHSRLL